MNVMFYSIRQDPNEEYIHWLEAIQYDKTEFQCDFCYQTSG